MQLPSDLEEEYHKNPDLKKGDVQTLQKWCEESTTVPNLTEFEVLLFLQSCHGDLVHAQKALEVFFSVKRTNPEIFLGRNPTTSPDLLRAMHTNLVTPLPRPTNEGHQIIFVRLMDADPNKYVFRDFIKLLDMVAMLMLYQNGTNGGLITVIDQSGYGFRHLLKISVGLMKVTLHYVQEAMPVRLKGVHFFNTHPVIGKVLTMMRPFVKKTVMDLIKAHGDIENLYEFVPKECLPNNYGGGAPSLENLHESQLRSLKENTLIFQREEELIGGSTKGAPNTLPNTTK